MRLKSRDKPINRTASQATVRYFSGKEFNSMNERLMTLALTPSSVNPSASTPDLRVEGAVGPLTGNINSPGNVHIAGNIVDLFAVKASGDIAVGGIIEAAQVEAGGNLDVSGGISGRGSGHCRAAGNITAHYIDNATVIARGDLRAETEITGSTIVCGGRLCVAAGPLVGGSASALGGIECAALGASSGVETIIEVGIDPALRAHVANLIPQIDRDLKKVAQIRQPVERLVKNLKLLNGEQKEKMIAMQFEADSLEAATQQILQDLLAEYQRVTAVARPEIEVSGTVHPGVILRFPGVECKVDLAIQGPLRLILRGIGCLRHVCALMPDAETPLHTQIVPNIFDGLRILTAENT
jgi:uncharacterized protein